MNSDMLTFDPVILGLRSLSHISVMYIAHGDMLLYDVTKGRDTSSSRLSSIHFYP